MITPNAPLTIRSRTSAPALLLACTLFAAGILHGNDAPPPAPPRVLPATPGARSDAADLEALLAFIPDVAATCKDGFTVTGDTLRDMLRPQLRLMIENGQPVDEDTIRSYAARLATSMIDHHLMTILAEQAGFKPDLDAAREQIETHKKQMGAANFRKQVELQGLSLDAIIAREAASAAIRAWMQHSIVPQAQVTDEDVNEHYAANTEAFQNPERFQASHILFRLEDNPDDEARAAARTRAAKILAQIRLGADFATMAGEHSDCPSKGRGGSLGTFRKGRMVPEFQEALEKLKAEEVSDLVETPFGYHIIKRGNIIPAEQIPLEKVRERIHRQLTAQKQKTAIDAALETIKAELEPTVVLEKP